MDFDVAVVGASSSGLYAAELLAQAGQRVAVFERERALVPARRTLIVTPRLSHALHRIPEAAVLHRIHVMAVATPGAAVSITLQEPDLVIERGRLARALADRARDAGVELRYGYDFLGFIPCSGGVTLRLRADDGREARVSARAVIGADGAFSHVAAMAGIRRPSVVPILQAEVRLPSDWDPAVTQVWFDARDTRFFYWLIPESSERAVVGLVGDPGVDMRALLRRFLRRHGLEPLGYQGALVAMHHPRLRPWARVGDAPVLLVGDAAGQVKVTTVGGTVTGFLGAAAAARALIKGTPYARELRALERELDLHWLLRVLLDRMDNAAYDRLVESITPRVRQILGRYTRDELTGALWRLLLSQPRLLVFGLRLLLQRTVRRPRFVADSSTMRDLTVDEPSG